MSSVTTRLRVLYLEPFLAGSHRAFTRVLTRGLPADWTVLTLPGRHWKWRMRGSAAHFALAHRELLARDYDLLFASSYVALAELRGLVPELATLPAVLYFHENQLAYPAAAGPSDRDHHFGFTQLTSCLAAQRCVFNSRYNLQSFLDEARELLRRLPDAVPPDWPDRIARRSTVLAPPLELPALPAAAFADAPAETERARGPILLWNHRWEHDKNPAAFFAALRALVFRQVPFRVAVCGERFRQAPPEFDDARRWLGDRVAHWGYLDSAGDYRQLLGRAHVAVSTAHHEFFGMAMLEATHYGARPLVPDRLAYRELFPAEHRYRDGELAHRLEQLCRDWSAGAPLRADRTALTARFAAPALLPRYDRLLAEVARDAHRGTSA